MDGLLDPRVDLEEEGIGGRADGRHQELTLLHERPRRSDGDAPSRPASARWRPSSPMSMHASPNGRARGQKAGECVELTLGFPEARNVVTTAASSAPEAERDVPRRLPAAVKPVGPKQAEDATLLRRELLARGGLEFTQSGYHQPHLREMALARRAYLVMGFEPFSLLSGQRPVQVSGHELAQLVARHIRR
jgi:hypothetical protein